MFIEGNFTHIIPILNAVSITGLLFVITSHPCHPSFYCMSFLLRITLNTLTLNVKSDKVYTRHGVPISVTGIAQVCFENWMTEIPLGFY